MNKDNIEDLVISLGGIYQAFQNKMMQMSIQQLLKGIKSPNTWSNYQYSQIQRFRERLKQQVVYFTKEINFAYEKALLLSYQQAINGEIKVDKEAKEFKVAIPERVSQVMEKVKEKNATYMKVLASEVERMHFENVNVIALRFGSPNYIGEVQELSRTKRVFEAIKTQVEKYGSVENVPKVNYKTKDNVSRQVSWKSYMEMNARTTIQQETNDYQVEAGGELGIVFYLCSRHSDCAKDHINEQGKIYYDDRFGGFGLKKEIEDKVVEYIKSNNLISIQAVKDNYPYLSTRPNCRHYFEPIPLMDLLDGKTTPEKSLKELSMDKGKGDSELYTKLQEQRYNERMIRKWKEKKDIQQQLVNASPDGETKRHEQLLLDKYTHKVSEWQKSQRELLKENPYLERNYDRENYKIVVEDLGYRASTK